ncbi:unnamed protein product, partial [Brassica oleracea var. botrytis]
DSSSSSSSILLLCVRFFFLFFVLLRFSFDSFDSPSTSEAIYAKNNPNPFDNQKQAFVVVGRVSTGIEAELKVLYGSGARKFARSCCSSWLTSH